MSDNSKIEWTEATWNPVTGCTKVSPGFDHCYAERDFNRFNGPGAFDTVRLMPNRLVTPLRWRRPRLVFVDSMSDLFHDDVPDDYIARVFAVMASASQHTFQVLTKRHGRMRSLLSSARWPELLTESPEWPPAFQGGLPLGIDIDPERPLDNVWLGVSVEDQKWANVRIPALLGTPAAVRFLSCEPLIGPVDLLGRSGGECEDYGLAVTHEGVQTRTDYGTGFEYDCDHQVGVDWVIVGGESGHGARPMHADWARSLRDQCAEAGVPFFMKQAGEVLAREWGCTDRKGHNPDEWPEWFPREMPTHERAPS